MSSEPRLLVRRSRCRTVPPIGRAAAIGSTLLLLWVASAAPASAAVPAARHPGVAVARATGGGAGAASESAQSVARFWTPERMRMATPVLPGNRAAAAPHIASQLTGRPAERAVKHRVEPASPVVGSRARGSARPAGIAPDLVPIVGEIFFYNPVATADVSAGYHDCTGAAVNSPSKRMVITAARCVYGGGAGGAWYQDWDFIPGYQYHDGTVYEPYGNFPAVYFGVEDGWYQSSDPSADVAMVETDSFFFGDVVDVVGGMGLDWSEPLPTSTAVVGYAWTCAPGTTPQTGPVGSCVEDQAQCSGVPRDGGQSMITLPCGYDDPNATGSPWVTAFDGQTGYVNGNLSVMSDDGTDASPYYGDSVYELYQTMGAL